MHNVDVQFQSHHTVTSVPGQSLAVMLLYSLMVFTVVALQCYSAGDAVTELIERDPKYIGEVHQVVTADGYILGVHHVVPRAPQSFRKSAAIPVVVVHGLLCSSADWFILGPGRAFGFVLANQGYDVWVPNMRGNTFSQRHKRLNVSSFEFWDFTFHEMALLDMPAVIDYILRKNTDYEHIYWAGHSQGVLTSFITLSELPRYSGIVAGVYAMSPVAYIGRIKSIFLGALSLISDSLGRTLRNSGRGNVLESSMGAPGEFFCNAKAATQTLCIQMMDLVVGKNNNEIDRTIIGELMTLFPAGASTKQIMHYGQLIRSRRFQKFDYSPNKTRNIQLYGDDLPPEYRMNQIRVPYTVFYAGHDALLVPQDAEQSIAKLTTLVKVRQIVSWNHMDFLYGKTANKLYKEIADSIGEAERKLQIKIARG